MSWRPTQRFPVACALALAALTLPAPCLPAIPAPAGATLQVRHLSTSEGDRRAEYPVAVLRLALERAGVEAELLASPVSMEQERAMRAVAAGKLIDVMWTVSTPEREQRLLPIRIPIDRGLIGWRVLLVRQDRLDRFAGLRTAEGLAPLVAAQGHDWPDLEVLRANGLRTMSTTRYSSLFRLLASGRADHVPRAVGEVVPEAAIHRDQGIVIEPTLLLHYPSAFYFFVQRENTRLADLLERGLRRAYEDGSLRTLFDQTFSEDIAALHLSRRQRIELANPLLAPGALDVPPGWRFDPGDAP